jgi:hypothetical protein
MSASVRRRSYGYVAMDESSAPPHSEPAQIIVSAKIAASPYTASLTAACGLRPTRHPRICPLAARLSGSTTRDRQEQQSAQQLRGPFS